MNLPPGTLLTYSAPWPEATPIGFTRLGEGQPRVFWEGEKSPLAFSGYGIAASFSVNGAERFNKISKFAQNLFKKIHVINGEYTPIIGPILFGGFSFKEGDGVGDPFWNEFSDTTFILPKTQLTVFGGETWLTINRLLVADDDPCVAGAAMREQVQDLVWEGLPGNYISPELEEIIAPWDEPTISPYSSQMDWLDIVQAAIGRIRAGEFNKVVLARSAHAQMSKRPSLPEIISRLGARYPDCYRFLFEPIPGKAFFGATPELLASVTDREFNTIALAGSAPRGKSWREDQLLGQELLDNAKEREEHDLVVRSLRENLSPHCVDLNIPETPELCLLNNIQHLLTPIKGKLENGSGILPVVEALHPTPALGGTPRGVAITLIEELEPLPRGWYGAPIGWLAPNGDGEFVVAIRSAVARDTQIRLYAGSGIVADSEPQKEWLETELKFQPILKALGVQNERPIHNYA